MKILSHEGLSLYNIIFMYMYTCILNSAYKGLLKAAGVRGRLKKQLVALSSCVKLSVPTPGNVGGTFVRGK